VVDLHPYSHSCALTLVHRQTQHPTVEIAENQLCLTGAYLPTSYDGEAVNVVTSWNLHDPYSTEMANIRMISF
jgi:hypothetical protein